jgi:P4 family phage/plasmid primase-like protien
MLVHKNITFLNNCRHPNKFESITLETGLNLIQSNQYKSVILALRSIKDNAIYKQDKTKLPCITFNGTFKESVKNSEFNLSSDIYSVDIDNLSGAIEDHKAKISSINSVIYSFVSPSGRGIKVGIRIQAGAVTNDTDFKRLFPAVKSLFEAYGYQIDEACKDIRRLTFVSWDPEIYLNYNAVEFDSEAHLENRKQLSPLFTPKNEALQLRTETAFEALILDEEDCIGKVTNILKGAKIGERHSARLKAGKLAGGYIAGGLIDEDKMISILLRVSDLISNNGFTTESEIKTIHDGIAEGKKSPLTSSEICNLFSTLLPSEGNEARLINFTMDVRDGTNTTKPLTELGNSYRLNDSYGDIIKYVTGNNKWMHWNDYWEWDLDSAKVRQLASSIHKAIYKEGEHFPKHVQYFATWARTSQTNKTIENSVKLLKDLSNIRIPAEVVDGNLFLVGIDNARQVIDLKKGIVRTAQKNDYITKTLNVRELGQSENAARWIQFLNQVFDNDQELINWLQRWCGYLLTGSTKEQCFLFCYGLGANGKSVFADVLRYILGDYAKAIRTETLTDTKRAAGAASPDLADLIGTRLALTTETEEGVALAESLIKALTGGDTLTVRPLYASPIQFMPQFKLIMLGNHKPLIKGNDQGIWRRVRLLPFTKTFTQEQKDIDLTDKLRAEAPHILAWCIEGCLAWQEKGLSDIPTTIKQATDEYKSDQDIIGQWLADCCVIAPHEDCEITILYNNYSSWCKGNGCRASSSRVLSRRLTERGFSTRSSNSKTYRTGLTVNFFSDHPDIKQVSGISGLNNHFQ